MWENIRTFKSTWFPWYCGLLSLLPLLSNPDNSFSTSINCFSCSVFHFTNFSARAACCLSECWLWLRKYSILTKSFLSCSHSSPVNSRSCWIQSKLSSLCRPTSPVSLMRTTNIELQNFRFSSQNRSNFSVLSSYDGSTLSSDKQFVSCLVPPESPSLVSPSPQSRFLSFRCLFRF